MRRVVAVAMVVEAAGWCKICRGHLEFMGKLYQFIQNSKSQRLPSDIFYFVLF